MVNCLRLLQTGRDNRLCKNRGLQQLPHPFHELRLATGLAPTRACTNCHHASCKLVNQWLVVIQLLPSSSAVHANTRVNTLPRTGEQWQPVDLHYTLMLERK